MSTLSQLGTMWLQSKIVMAIRSQNKISDLASTHWKPYLWDGWFFRVSQGEGRGVGVRRRKGERRNRRRAQIWKRFWSFERGAGGRVERSGGGGHGRRTKCRSGGVRGIGWKRKWRRRNFFGSDLLNKSWKLEECKWWEKRETTPFFFFFKKLTDGDF